MSGRPNRARSKIQFRTRPTALGGPEGSFVKQPYSVSRPTIRFIRSQRAHPLASFGTLVVPFSEAELTQGQQLETDGSRTLSHQPTDLDDFAFQRRAPAGATVWFIRFCQRLILHQTPPGLK